MSALPLVNNDLADNNLPRDATVDNVHWVDGLPINHEFVWKAQPNGYKVSFTRYNTNTIHVKVDNHGAFSNICYGTIQYDYTAGATNFNNTLKTVSHSVDKDWADGKTPPEDSVIVVELQGTVQRLVNPQPEGQTEPLYETVPVDLTAAGVTQKIQVTLNGGKDGGDDTAENPWKYTWENLPEYNKETEGDPLKITYSVKEISYTIGGHTVNLKDFGPTEDNSTEGLTKITNQIPAYDFEILKIDAGTAQMLEGAGFTIQRIQPASEISEPTLIGEPSNCVPEVTGENGKVSFNDIPLGYYVIEETQLSDGYVLVEDGKFYIRIDTDGVKLLEKVISDDGKLSFTEVQPGPGGRIKLGNVELTVSGNNITFTVENTLGAALPAAGGPGTNMLYFLGFTLIGLAGAGFVVKKKRREAAENR